MHFRSEPHHVKWKVIEVATLDITGKKMNKIISIPRQITEWLSYILFWWEV